MSEGFHVHGAHDHAIEHAAEIGHADSFSGRIAVMTAILSTAGAVFGYQGGATQNEALLLKNEAAIHKTEAANQWAYYQAKGQKQAIAELMAQLPGVDQAAANREALRYGAEKEQIRQKAEAQERAARDADGPVRMLSPSSPLGTSRRSSSGFYSLGGNHAAHAAPMVAGGIVRGRCDWRCAGYPFNAPHLGKR